MAGDVMADNGDIKAQVVQTLQVLLQDCATGRYVTGPDGWTPEQAKALQFAACSSAIEFARTNQLKNLQLVILYAPNGQEIRLPINEPAAAKSPPR
jgi:hypothetical protein